MKEPDATSVMGDSPEKGRTVMRYVLDHVAKRGRNGDDMLAHSSKGDLNLPVESLKGNFKSELDALLKKHGIDQGRYTVGGEGNSIHPDTGLPEFFGDDGGGSAEGGRAEGGAGASTGGPGTGASDGAGTGGPGAVGGGGSAADKAAEAATSSVGTTTSDTGKTGVAMGGEIGSGHSLGVSTPGIAGPSPAGIAASLGGTLIGGPLSIGNAASGLFDPEGKTLGSRGITGLLDALGIRGSGDPIGGLTIGGQEGFGKGNPMAGTGGAFGGSATAGPAASPAPAGAAPIGGQAQGDPEMDFLLSQFYGNQYATGPR
jgi:hypothetical protein